MDGRGNPLAVGSRLQTSLAAFSLTGEMAENTVNADQLIARHLATGCKCAHVAKHPEYDHVTVGRVRPVQLHFSVVETIFPWTVDPMHAQMKRCSLAQTGS